MRKSFKLSAIALLTTALTTIPVHALSLNVGGNGPLVDLGNDNNANATVSVDTGNVLGGDTGSSGTSSDSAVQVNLGSVGDDSGGGPTGGNGLIDLGGDNDNALIDLDGDLIDLGGGGNGGLLDLGDNGNLVDFADLNLGDGDLFGLGSNGNLLDSETAICSILVTAARISSPSIWAARTSMPISISMTATSPSST